METGKMVEKKFSPWLRRLSRALNIMPVINPIDEWLQQIGHNVQI
jgi:truncated hemoglobin YjbI